MLTILPRPEHRWQGADFDGCGSDHDGEPAVRIPRQQAQNAYSAFASADGPTTPRPLPRRTQRPYSSVPLSLTFLAATFIAARSGNASTKPFSRVPGDKISAHDLS